MSLSIDLTPIKNYLDRLESVRESIIKQSRDLLRLSKAVISSIVSGEDASTYIEKMQELFVDINAKIKECPELAYSNMFFAIATEYAEAMQLYYIRNRMRILSIDELNINPLPYLMSLLEVIGELKRVSLECLRRGDLDEAYNFLRIAEEVYNALLSFSYPEALLPGFRRKLDIYRKVLDDWKKFLIDMDSRRSLIKSLSEALKYIRSSGLE